MTISGLVIVVTSNLSDISRLPLDPQTELPSIRSLHHLFHHETQAGALRCHRSITEVTNTDTQTHSHPQAICVSPFHLFCLSVVCGRKPTHTHQEHETCRLWGDRTNHRAAAPCWHLTWASVVKSKCMSPPALWTSTLPLSTAPFPCQTAAWSYLSPAHLRWKNTLLPRHRKAFICILKTRCSFHKISHANRMKSTKKKFKNPTWSNRRSRVLSPAFKLSVSLVWISYLLCQNSEIHRLSPRNK